MNNIYLIGMPLAGKSTLARLLGKKLNIEVIDTDELLLQYGLTKEAAINLPDTFRQEETKLYLNDYNKPFVMATGGGVISDAKNFLNFKGLIIYLYLDPASLYYRSTKYYHPVYEKFNYLQLFEKRDPIYRQYANLIIDVSSSDLSQVVKDIINKL